MDDQALQRLLNKYFVPHMGLYTEPRGEVTAIVLKLDANTRPTEADCRFLRDKGLSGLADYAEHYARTGRADRRLLRTPEDRKREARDRNRRLRGKYELDFIDEDHYPRLMKILRGLEDGVRLSDGDVIWLEESGHFTPALRRSFHFNEARHHELVFERSGDLRDAVAANSHYRKASEPQRGLQLLGGLDFEQSPNNRVGSALWTTRGGSLRDLGRAADAMDSARQGHQLDPRSFHPCTLLGALHYEAGDRAEGDLWFQKAIERGANPEAIDSELQAIWRRAGKARRDEIRRHLLAIDPIRYAWVKQQASKAKTATRPPRRTGGQVRPPQGAAT